MCIPEIDLFAWQESLRWQTIRTLFISERRGWLNPDRIVPKL